MSTNLDDVILFYFDEDDKPVYENDFMVVKKLLGEIKTQSPNWVKRVQVVNWKQKKTSIDELDIRRYSIKDNKYSKGISFTQPEFKALLDIVKNLEKDMLE